MKILVLGGTGYVGAKLIESMTDDSENEHDIYCAVRPTSNVEKIDDKGVKIIPVGSLEGLDEPIDVFVNLSCKYMKKKECSDDVIESNLCVPLQVLSKCIDLGVKKVVTIGTGLPDGFNEYAFTKKMFSDYGRWISEKNAVTSFYNVKLETYYGPDEPSGRFIPNVIDKMKKNEPVELTEGFQKRDIVHIDDVVQNLKRMIFDLDVKGYNEIPLGTGEAPTIRDITGYLKDICGSKSDMIYGAVPMRSGEPDSVADSELMKRYGIETNIHWKNGLRSVCEARR